MLLWSEAKALSRQSSQRIAQWRGVIPNDAIKRLMTVIGDKRSKSKPWMYSAAVLTHSNANSLTVPSIITNIQILLAPKPSFISWSTWPNRVRKCVFERNLVYCGIYVEFYVNNSEMTSENIHGTKQNTETSRAPIHEEPRNSISIK